MNIHAGAYFLFCFLFSANSLKAETYTYPQLVRRMTDMQELAKLPPAGEKTSLISSYDRASQYDAASGKYLKWGANADGDGVVRQEGDTSVLADIKGPGCIWRTWSASAGDGHVKIYLDGATTPTVDLRWLDYFTGKVPPFNRPNLVYSLASKTQPPGFDNYTPIPFQKSCKIVADKGWGKYYQFNYTQFPAGTVVPTFQMKLSPEDSASLDQANQILGQCGQEPNPYPNARTSTTTINAHAGKETLVTELTGAGAITALKVKLDLPKDPETQRILLRQLTVSITWDDDKTPAVWSPLGDFFGFVGGAMPYQSLPLGLLEDGTFYSYWYMPYGKKARIVVGNDGSQPVAMTWQVTQAPLTQPIASFARFHAKWHRDAFLPESPDRAPDWTLLTTQGRGRYVGTHLHGWNARGSWWGEGDDKFFVDGEKFPSSFGTGSEDYFGFAWSSEKLFSKPYHNQILNENNEGHFVDNRWHIPDSVPFQTSFEGCIEKYFSNARGTFYAAEAFWYLSPGGIDPYGPVPLTDRIGYWVMPKVYHEPGVIEGESLKALNPQVDTVQIRNTLGFSDAYSGGHQLEWWGRRYDKKLVLNFPVAKAGKYHFIIHCDHEPNRGKGIVQISVDDKPIGPTLELSSKTPWTPGDPVDLGIIDLTAGQHALGIQLVGQNDPASRFVFGLDYIKLVPAS